MPENVFSRPKRRSAKRRPAFKSPLHKAQLTRPHPGSQVLKRPRLLQALAEHVEVPVSMIVAEAGYGKTTLLSTYVRSVARPVVWYALMPSDADLAVFGRYLLEGFRREAPRFGKTFRRALDDLKPGERSAQMLAGAFANEIATLRGKPYLLVLDDFQEVAGDARIVAFMEQLVRLPPANLRILIASRSVPAIGVERLRARGQVFELHSGHLRLTHDELGRLFTDVYEMPLSDDELSALEETTLGWPTAVHLARESLRRSPDTRLEDVLASFRASHLELHDYLSCEVHARLDEVSRQLLEATAPLTRFDADMVATLTGQRGHARTLEVLARRGLLQAFGEGAFASYECHELVRRFVRHDIESRDGTEAWRTLEKRAAEAFEARGQTEPALRHYLQSGSVEHASRLLRGLAPELLKHGRALALKQFLVDLPGAAVRADSTLTLALADAQQNLGAWDEAEPLYRSVLERCRAGSDTPQPGDPWTVRERECRSLLGLGKVLNLRGQHEQVLGMAERGLAVREIPLYLRCRLMEMKAGAHFYVGQYRAAIRVLDEVRALLTDADEPELLLPTIHNLAIAHASQGRFREASDQFRIALAQVRGSESPRAPTYLSNLSFLLSELGELNEARRAAEEGLAAARRFSNPAQACTCQQALAQAHALSGDLEAAVAALHEAETLNAELRMEVIAADLLMLRGRIFCARREYRRAVEFLTLAIEKRAHRPDDPQLTECRALLAWCELRAGRVRVANDLLEALRVPAQESENEFLRMRVHYWLAEVSLALDNPDGADRPLRTALELVRTHGFRYFLKVQAREEPSAVLHGLARGIELDLVCAALVHAGPAIERGVLEQLGSLPVRSAEAAVAVLGEVGGRESQQRLPAVAKRRRGLKAGIGTALRHIEDRLERGVGSNEAATATPRLVLFGPPRLEIDGQVVPASAWRAQRAFHLLVYLALNPRGASREELLERFWPSRQLAAGKRNFHPTLSYVRKVLPASEIPPILREGELYRLNPAYPFVCDVWDFDCSLEEARGEPAAGTRRSALEAAAAIVKGTFLEGWYMDWADDLQIKIGHRIQKMHLDLGEACAQLADFEAAFEAFRRASELDPYREETRLAMIECLVRIGNRGAALVEYDKLKGLLRKELAIEPLPETEEAMQRLIAGQPVRPWPAGPPGLGAQTETPSQGGAQQHVERSTQAEVKPRVRRSGP